MLKKNQHGVTLIELAIAIAIIAISLFGILSVFKVSVTHSSDPVTKKQVVLISETLLEEISSKSFIKPTEGFNGPFTIENRHKFDAVSDYNGLEMNGISTATGVSIPTLQNYNVKISTQNKALGTLSSTDSLLITINVTGPNDSFVLKGYKINDE